MGKFGPMKTSSQRGMDEFVIGIAAAPFLPGDRVRKDPKSGLWVDAHAARCEGFATEIVHTGQIFTIRRNKS